ncbi:MAG: SH3 domain-containing protein [Clostridia bacterium]|nr:SH3 domain-containing protein [Clostridia bacterium]
MNQKNRRYMHTFVCASAGILLTMFLQCVLVRQVYAQVGVNAGASKITASSEQKVPAKDVPTKIEVSAAETISSGKIAETQQETAPEIKATDSKWGNIVVTKVKDSLNVRSEASEESELVGKLYRDNIGEVLETNGEWTKVKSGNLTGWAKNEFLISGDEATKMADSVVKTVATVKTETLRVRKEASEEAGIYGLLALGDEEDVVKEENGWVLIQLDEDTVGYVSSEYVDITSVFPSGETVEEIEKREKAEEELKVLAAKEEVKASRTAPTAKTNNGAIAGDVNDVQLLAALIQCEAGYEIYEGQVAIGTVVLNRLRTGRYGNNIYSVIYAKGQFGPAGSGKVANVYAQGPKAICIQAAQEALAGSSLVGTATHFRSVNSGYPGIVIGNHVFW